MIVLSDKPGMATQNRPVSRKVSNIPPDKEILPQTFLIFNVFKMGVVIKLMVLATFDPLFLQLHFPRTFLKNCGLLLIVVKILRQMYSYLLMSIKQKRIII